MSQPAAHDEVTHYGAGFLKMALRNTWELAMSNDLLTDLTRAAAALPPLLTRNQAAEFAHVTLRTISRWLEDGRITAAKTHPGAGRGRTLILKSSLLAMLAGEV